MRIKKLLVCSLFLTACSASSQAIESFIKDGQKVNINSIENISETKKEEVKFTVKNFLYASTFETQTVFYNSSSEKPSKISQNQGSNSIFVSFESSYLEVRASYSQKEIVNETVNNLPATSIHFLIRKTNDEYKVETDEYTYNGETIYGKYLDGADEAIKRMFIEYPNLPFSWNFINSFNGTNVENPDVSKTFTDALVLSGNIDQGSYKIGLKENLVISFDNDSKEVFNGFVYSYSDFLLRSPVSNLDVFSHGTTTTTKTSVTVSYNI
ncbi:MAG: hypothetical protein SPL02_00095 [Bacilli bacterium]|nr:hypothetical protein [Bacilli bacterium]MDY6430569.1 hypothetical protein [Bacilli bacterium]